jgi:hypothetical protein
VPVDGPIPGANSLACSLLTDTTPERPELMTQVTRRLTPRSVSRPPRSSPLVAECVKTVAPLGVAPAVAVAGANATSPTTSATIRTTLAHESTAKARRAYQRDRPSSSGSARKRRASPSREGSRGRAEHPWEATADRCQPDAASRARFRALRPLDDIPRWDPAANAKRLMAIVPNTFWTPFWTPCHLNAIV